MIIDVISTDATSDYVIYTDSLTQHVMNITPYILCNSRFQMS